MAGSKTLKVIIAGDAAGALKAMSDVGSGSDGLAGKFSLLGKAAGAGFVAVGVAAVAAGAALFKVGDDFSHAYDKIRVGTGATGAAFEGLKDDLKATLAQVPASMEDVGTAITSLNQRLGLTGKPLQDLSVQFLNLSRITKVDLSTAVADLTRVFGDWSIKDQSKAMDEMFRASQKTGVGIEQLSEQVVQFGAPLRGLGFGFEESVAMLAKWEKEGVNVENVMGAMKKAYGQFSKEFGQRAPEEFRKFVAEIAKAPNAAAGAAMAIQKLGVRNGPDFAAAVTEGRFAYGDLVDAITNGTDTINKAAGDTEHFGEKWQKFVNQLEVAVEPLASGVFDLVGNAIDGLSPVFREVTGGFTALVAAFKAGDGDITSSGFPGFMEQVGQKAREAYDGVKTFVDGLSDEGGLSGAIQKIYDKNQGLKDSVDNVKGAFLSFWNDVLVPVGNWIRDELNTNVLPKLQGLLQWFSDTGWPAISKAAQQFYEIVLKPMFEFIGQNQEAFKNLGVALAVIAGVIVGAAVVVGVLTTALMAMGVVLAGTIVTAVVAAVAEIVNLAEVVWDVFNNVRDALGGALDFLENGVQVLWDVLQNIGSGIAKLPGIIGGALSAVAGVVGGVISTIAGAVAGFATRLPGLIAGWATAFWGWLETLQAELPGRLAYVAGFVIGWVTGTAVRLQENISNWATAALSWAVATATELPGHLAAIAGALWGWVSSTAAALPGQVAAITSQIWEWVAGVASALPGLLAGWAAQFAGWAAGLAGAIGSWLASTSSAIAGWVWGVASALPGQLAGWAGQFRDWAYGLAASFGGWLSASTGALIGWVQGIPGALAGAVSAMVNVGRGIVEGIWNGISGAGGWLMDKVRSFASGIVDGFKSALGQHSPARALFPVGEGVTQGIGVGMLNEAPGLQRSIVELMGGMQFPTVAGTVSPNVAGVSGPSFAPFTPPFTPPSPTALPSAVSTGGPVSSGPQMVTVQLVVDRRVLAETVADVSRQRNGVLR